MAAGENAKKLQTHLSGNWPTGSFSGYPQTGHGYPAYRRAAASFGKGYGVPGADAAWGVMAPYDKSADSGGLEQ